MDVCNHTYILSCTIVNFGVGSKVLKYAKQKGVSGGTILLGKGTVRSHLLKLLDLDETRKEIVLFITKKDIVNNVFEYLDEKLKFNKPNHGIAFTLPLGSIVGSRGYKDIDTIESRGVGNIMYSAIFTIVDRGKAESVIDASVKAGSQGGTILHGRGSGIHEKSTLFNMPIEPEKDVVLILSEKEKADNIIDSIKDELELDKPGNGILFVLDTLQTYGIFKKTDD